MRQYAIWNKKDPIFTPNGRMYTSEQWIEQHPIAGLNHVTIVCSASELNGAVFGVLSQMVLEAQSLGCDFSSCTTDEEKLEAIEAFYEARNAVIPEPSAEERIAAALEYQNAIAE